MLDPTIIFEDNHLLIICKTPGFLAQPDGRGRPDLLAWAEKYLARNKPGRAYVGLVHRLDLSVGGVMALAKTSKAAERLSRQFRERSVKKIYRALVNGEPPGTEGRLESRLFRDGSLTRLASPRENGTLAILNWRLLARHATMSLLEIELLTGFKHQIRAQLAILGRTIVGDAKYGSSIAPEGPAIGLWAVSLSIDHPTKKERLVFRSDPGPFWPWTLWPAAGADF